ncbi:phosphotriesterase family protein [Lacrimispora sp.]|uniref:phosphotriesterase family protein n=1 Tax=Lacrimispora sp. TaxID=2719234 RepID=UPI00289B4ADD|nr:hypothetical protein [Lacrimispora sp.]
MIQTVKGPINQKILGITMCHEHLAMDLSRIRGDDDSDFSCEDTIIEEIRAMMKYGVKSLVEVTTNDMGRDVKQLFRISEACGLNIVCSTGFYLEQYHPKSIAESEPKQICDIFLHDIQLGIAGTEIKAGIIGEVASSMNEITKGEEIVLKGAAKASVVTAVAVTTHCHFGTMAIEQARLLVNEGMNPDKIILGHLDLADDRDYYAEVLKTGVNIGFDTIGKTSYLSDEKRADNLMWLIDKGYEDKIILSQDISRKSYFSCKGTHSGYMSVMKDFVPLLLNRGINQEILNKLLQNNPARILNF